MARPLTFRRSWTTGAGFLLAILAIHLAGRAAAVGSGDRTDSLLYGVSAWRFWSSSASAEDLILDKPAGQLLLTGWIYHLWPGGPSRISVVPLESAFMLAACAAFWMLCTRLYGSGPAGWATICFVLVHNVCNALDPTTDGLNLNENYTALPLVLTAWAHLRIDRPARRGLARGLAVGLALTVKPTAVAMLAALVLHDLPVAAARGGRRILGVLWSTTAAGMVVAWVPVLTVLAVRGWLGPHLGDLLIHAPRHVGPVAINLMIFRALTAMLPVLFCAAAGLLAGGGRRFARRDLIFGSPVVFGLIWLLAELAMICSLTIPALHYCQNLAAPAGILAAAGLSAVRRGLACLERRLRAAAGAWLTAALISCICAAFSPLLSAAVIRARGFDPSLERRQFEEWLRHWSPRHPARAWEAGR